MKKSSQVPWVAPLSRLPFSLMPLLRLQRRHYGMVLNPVRWWGRFPRLFWLIALFVGYLERRQSSLTPSLRALVMTRVSQRCDCAFCIDANSLRLAQHSGSLEKVLAVADWQQADCFVSAERAALAYADAVTATPPQVTPELQQELRRHFDDRALTELTALVAFQNLSARFNAALAIPAQGLCTPPTGRSGGEDA
ncbi:hypothetical protein A9798_05240 [Edwardsiella hoshinae]|uniref:Arsenate reductase and related proteins, glutaredoxin family n=1 Tax=Edwardsiella hoshinae TaxID=93378 RepID=A0A376DB67_9GAMM|nr:carboxymuconolactone decarboxylase family protein [Edwardsiella hoshinae]AOV96405.1 hypothetical protein A9798_05240 [Edwardsiella hoshinae]QPR27714.1 carboxymuconolactone decarboxylase family protein [Edwardsiella hoshinae]STC86274.1 Arsenate reductase and related proteins, glutaredoxin family [Edwardsiella hoshinae]